MKSLFSFFCICVILFSGSVSAMTSPLYVGDEKIELRLKEISKELRCLVCQNQTLADSHAGLADDLRVEIRDLMKKGKTDKEVIDYLVYRYGDFVKYSPSFNKVNFLLWFGPFLLLVFGFMYLYKSLKLHSVIGEDGVVVIEEDINID